MTSIPVWPVFSQKTLNESKTDTLEAFNGNHFLIDELYRTSFRASSSSNVTSFTTPCDSHSSQNAFISSLPGTSFNRMTNYAWTSSSNTVIFMPDNSQTPNDCTMNHKLNEPTTTGTLKQHLTKAESLSNNDINIKQFSNLPNNQTLLETKRPKKEQDYKRTLDFTKSVQLNESATNKTVGGISNDSILENYSSYSSHKEDFSCRICDMTFWTEELLKTHLEGSKFSCRICTHDFINHSELKDHFLSHQSYRCSICKKVFLSKEDLFNHKKMSLLCTSKFECNICMKMLVSKENLRKHKQSFHQNDNNKYSCVVCNKTFLLPFKLNAHQNLSHVAYENIECKVCGFYFLGPEKIKSHIKKAHLNKREICPFNCSICGKVLYFKDALIRHEKTHNKVVEMVACEICGKSYKGAKGLYSHMRHYHQKLRSMAKCSKCNMEFKRQCSLRVHLHNVHKEKVLISAVCEICGKTLKNKEQLKSHLLIHSSERPFKCNICNATFKQKVALLTHSRIHTGICKYNCNDCGKSFRWKQTFDKHINKCKAPLNG